MTGKEGGMNILITAGGTAERIDSVRTITNMATGELGSLIADTFATHAEVAGIWYVCARNARRPSASCAEIVEVGSAEDLQTALTRLLSTQKIDAVIHTMAVSDYTLRSLTTAERLASSIAGSLVRDGGFRTADETQLATMIATSITEQDGGLTRQGKVSSEVGHLILTMKKTPKIIGQIKRLQPSTILVGFKLLDGVSEQELVRVGHDLLVRNHCDFVLANDLQQIGPGRHAGLLLRPDGSFVRLQTDGEIAQAIVDSVLQKGREGEP